MDVTAYPLKHKVTCFGFLMEEPIKRGKLDAQKAKQLGATGKDMGLLSAGQDITLANGTVIRSVDVVGEPRKGKKLLLLGDTCDSSATIEHAMECDVVVHEVGIMFCCHLINRQLMTNRSKRKQEKVGTVPVLWQANLRMTSKRRN